ncbi:hypothetical protein J3459_011850 [Metarhizium acridum]|uniref:uncharacterized protein n=1 Tax=Metarhizium acridum TaxID=92637 RepID=UPI001C6B3959|nr:hypothetical protein J3458_009546 [Metarhizium acridum]KAG8418990.1 hypothetical protein J3459_011850 [Metarhizium acridum]
MNSVQDPDSAALSIQFCNEAERHWADQCEVDSLLNIAAALFLSLGYLGQGRDHSVLYYIEAASNMAERMRLFELEVDPATGKIRWLLAHVTSAYQYAAWGTFNWITHMSLFHRQPGLKCPKQPPRVPAPGTRRNDTTSLRHLCASEDDAELAYMGGVFCHLCEFWTIMHEVALMYTKHSGSLLTEQRTLRFAEYKFRELLAWSNRLPTTFSQNERHPHYVQVLQ